MPWVNFQTARLNTVNSMHVHCTGIPHITRYLCQAKNNLKNSRKVGGIEILANFGNTIFIQFGEFTLFSNSHYGRIHRSISHEKKMKIVNSL